MPFLLRLIEDRLEAGARAELPAGVPRVLYIADGTTIIAVAGSVACLEANSAWHGKEAVSIRAAARPVRVLRYELGSAGSFAASNSSRCLLEASLALDPAQPQLLRCDRVDFPPGGIAYTHTHQGPGIRCLLAGRIRIETQGRSHDYGPGEAWFETGPDPVLAITGDAAPSHFIRVMVLPRSLLGKSSIRYVKPEDQDKPKRQSYQIFIDEPIDL